MTTPTELAAFEEWKFSTPSFQRCKDERTLHSVRPDDAWCARAFIAAKREAKLQDWINTLVAENETLARKVDKQRATIQEQALQIVSAHGETQNALDRVAELEKDAGRYRWLRQNSTQPTEQWSTHENPESLDAAIDAMKDAPSE